MNPRPTAEGAPIAKITLPLLKGQSQYVAFPPSRQAAFDLFAGEWSSRVPEMGVGHADVFDDPRVHWFAGQCGGFDGKRVLELGPLEAGHTCMMAKAGAHVTAIEGNIRAFMKCLIVQNAMGFAADFQLGDFAPYLAETQDRYDFLVMSGVLYHMTDPLGIVTNAARVADSIGVWTHYFDPAINLKRPELRHKFDETPHVVEQNGKRFEMHRQKYKKALNWAGFCGGPSKYSYWLTRQSLIDLFEAQGFSVTIGDDDRNHQNGPTMLLYAARNR